MTNNMLGKVLKTTTLAMLTAGLSLPVTSRANYFTVDSVADVKSPKTVRQRFFGDLYLCDNATEYNNVRLTSLNDFAPDSYFGKQTLFAGAKNFGVEHKMLADQSGVNSNVAGIYFSNKGFELDVGLNKGQAVLESRYGFSALGLGWYALAGVTTGAHKPSYVFGEVEATRKISKHLGLIGRVTANTYAPKPLFHVGVKYEF